MAHASTACLDNDLFLPCINELLEVFIVRPKNSPQDAVLFHGFLNMAELNFAEKILIKGLGVPVGDFRNWDSIMAWANEIAHVLQKEYQYRHPTT